MWKLMDSAAGFETQGIRTWLDARHPQLGFLSTASNGRFLQLLPRDSQSGNQLKLVETYVRGDDLVATYEPLPTHQVQPHVYWRAKHCTAHGAVGVEMIVSMQTSLLDSDPETILATGMPTGLIYGTVPGKPTELISLPPAEFPRTTSKQNASSIPMPGIYVYQPRDTPFAYVEMIHPDDFVSTTVELGKFVEPWITTRLFTERLEKGVIRRARASGWHIPRHLKVTKIAWALYHQFAAEPLPLTA